MKYFVFIITFITYNHMLAILNPIEEALLLFRVTAQSRKSCEQEHINNRLKQCKIELRKATHLFTKIVMKDKKCSTALVIHPYDSRNLFEISNKSKSELTTNDFVALGCELEKLARYQERLNGYLRKNL